MLTEEGCGQSVAGRVGGAGGSGLLPGCEFRLQPLACGLGDLGRHLTSLGLRFLTCRVRGVVVLTSQGHRKEEAI